MPSPAGEIHPGGLRWFPLPLQAQGVPSLEWQAKIPRREAKTVAFPAISASRSHKWPRGTLGGHNLLSIAKKYYGFGTEVPMEDSLARGRRHRRHRGVT